MSKRDAEEAFVVLRPACVGVSQCPSQQSLSNLEKLLESRPWPPVPQLATYCVFPIVKRLKEPRLDESTLVGCSRCLAAAVKGFSGALQPRAFHDILTVLVMLLSSKDDMTVPSVLKRNLSEEEKAALVSCIQALIVTGGRTVCEMLSPSRLPAMGHIVALLLELAEKEKSQALRISCMLTLDCLCLASRGLQSDMEFTLNAAAGTGHQFTVNFAKEKAVNHLCAFSLAHFLPGIASGLSKVMSGDEKQGQKVTQAAVYLWTSCIAYVMVDANRPGTKPGNNGSANSSSSSSSSNSATNGSPPQDGKLPAVAYSTAEWWKTAGGHVHSLLKQTSTLHAHQQWKVRLFVVRMASTLLEHCKLSLSASVTVLVEMLVALIADPYAQVAEAARAALAQFSQHIGAAASVSLVSLLEAGIYRAATGLPSVLRGTDDRKKLSCALLLQGYIQLLGPRLSTLLSSPNLVERLFHALLMALEIDTSHASILVCHSLANGDGGAVQATGAHLQRSQLSFKHFQDEAIFKALHLSCSLLGFYGELSGILDSLLDILLVHAHLHKQVILMMNTVMSGAAGLGLDGVVQLQKNTGNDNLVQHIRFLLGQYTEPRVWQVPTEQPAMPSDGNRHLSTLSHLSGDRQSLESRLRIVTTATAAVSMCDSAGAPGMKRRQRTSVLTVEILRSNVVLVCLLLDGLRTFALILGQDFDQFLVQSLFPVLEKAGNDNLRIRDASYACLQTMATSCCYESISHLIGANADYLLNMCTQHLRILQQHALAARVMRETLAYSDASLLRLLNAFLDEILTVLEMSVGTGDELTLIPILRAAVCAVRRWVKADSNGTEPSEAPKSNGVHPIGLSDSLFLSPKSTAVEESGCKPAASMDEIGQFFMDYHHKKVEERKAEEDAEKAAQDGGDDGSGADSDVDTSDSVDQPDQQKKLSDGDNVGKRVLSYCVHLLPVTNVQTCLTVLDTVEQGMLLLRSNREQLLPLVHQLWAPLLHRVRHSNHPVATKAVDVIAVVADVAGDFVRARVMSDIVPALMQVLQRPVPAKFSQHHSLLMSVFTTLGVLSEKLDLPEKEIVRLSNMCAGFLSTKMPTSVQGAAVKLFRHWATSYADCIWLLLLHFSTPNPYQMTTPHPKLLPVQLLARVNPRMMSDLSANATKILECL